MKTKKHNSFEPVDSQQYKKKYILRVIEDNEAEEEIRIAKRKHTPPINPEMPEVQRVDETTIYKQ